MPIVASVGKNFRLVKTVQDARLELPPELRGHHRTRRGFAKDHNAYHSQHGLGNLSILNNPYILKLSHAHAFGVSIGGSTVDIISRNQDPERYDL